MDDHLKLLAHALQQKEINVRNNVSGSELTTYRVGGKIAFLITLTSLNDVEIFSTLICNQFLNVLNPENVVTIGKGSNVIVDDDGFDGFVINLNGKLTVFNGEQSSNGSVVVAGGVALPILARQACSAGLGGLEFYVGIPGTVGGAVAMNAGGHGRQTSDVLISTEVLNMTDGTINEYKVDQCDFSYRHSRIRNNDLVISAAFSVEDDPVTDLKIKIDEIVQWRRENQPGGRNVGSIFQNSEDESSGSLIEKCGLKGYRLGTAYVSEKHANFIQADPGASARDIKKLISHIQKVVFEQTGNKLKTEVRYIGNTDE